MPALYDEDTCNTLVAEDKAYDNWLQGERNRILRMADTTKKQEAWDKLHIITRDEDNSIPY